MLFISLMLLPRCIKLLEHVCFLYVFPHRVCHVSSINSSHFLLNQFFSLATHERIHMDSILRTVNMLLRFVFLLPGCKMCCCNFRPVAVFQMILNLPGLYTAGIL